jgi:hypothetical protein
MFNVSLGTRSFQYFPAKPLFVAHTFFTDGHRLVVANAQPNTRLRKDPNVTALRFADVNDPLDFVDRYRAALRDALAAGRQFTPILSAKEFVDKPVETHRETGARLKRRGYYTLADAVALTFTTRDRDEL